MQSKDLFRTAYSHKNGLRLKEAITFSLNETSEWKKAPKDLVFTRYIYQLWFCFFMGIRRCFKAYSKTWAFMEGYLHFCNGRPLQKLYL